MRLKYIKSQNFSKRRLPREEGDHLLIQKFQDDPRRGEAEGHFAV